ncbi:hypothetical protein HY634_03940 [Candidatus Uhrbacteria bacterium]|nr:hypothetical protein [Candidatus Uhrbacteria bacterium]
MPTARFLASPLLVVALIGAGCGAQTAPTPPPSQTETSAPAPIVSPPPPPVSVPQAAAEVCPLTPEIVKRACKLTGEVTRSPYKCSFDASIEYGAGFGIQKAAILQALVGSVWFPIPAGSDMSVQGIIDAQRATVNEVARQSGFMSPCDRWESRTVSGVGDEAMMVPIVLIGCDASRVASLSTLPKGATLYLRKGTEIAQVSSTIGDVDGHEGCSPEEVIDIAREYIVPAMLP